MTATTRPILKTPPLLAALPAMFAGLFTATVVYTCGWIWLSRYALLGTIGVAVAGWVWLRINRRRLRRAVPAAPRSLPGDWELEYLETHTVQPVA